MVPAELLEQEALLYPALVPDGGDNKRQSQQAPNLPQGERHSENSHNNRGVDRVPHDGVWSGSNEPVLDLDRDYVTPVCSEGASCPEGEPHAGRDQRNADKLRGNGLGDESGSEQAKSQPLDPDECEPDQQEDGMKQARCRRFSSFGVLDCGSGKAPVRSEHE